MPRAEKYRIPWQKTCWSCNADSLQFSCTDELAPLDRFISQHRALKALRFGLEVDKPGYNLFVTGLTCTGKASAIKAHLQGLIDDLARQEKRKPISDWCYVHNFDDPDRPRALARLPQGKGKDLSYLLNEAQVVLREEIPKVLKSEQYETQRRALEESGRQAEQKLISQLERTAEARTFSIQVTPAGVSIFPLIEDRPMTPEEYQKLEPDRKQALDDIRSQLMQEIQDTMSKTREFERDTSDKIKALERATAEAHVSDIFRQLMDRSSDYPNMRQYLVRLIEYVLDNLSLFKGAVTPEGSLQPLGTLTLPAGGALARNPFLPFEINVLVDNGGVETVPIVVEPNPNLGEPLRAHRTTDDDGHLLQ